MRKKRRREITVFDRILRGCWVCGNLIIEGIITFIRIFTDIRIHSTATEKENIIKINNISDKRHMYVNRFTLKKKRQKKKK